MNHLRTLLAATTTWANWLIDQARLSHAAIVDWHRRLIAAQHYHGQHRPGVERARLLDWFDDQQERIQQWLDDHPLPPDEPDGYDQPFLPAVKEPTGELAHYDKSAGAGEYGRLRDVPLRLDEVRHLEAMFTRTETNPMRLPLRYEEYDDELYAEVMAG